MLLKNKDSQFKLTISGYEFPNATNADDANWLNVKVDCKHYTDEWSVKGVFIRTIELVELREWLSSIRNQEQTISRKSFTEHELAFEYSTISSALSVYLDFDCHPKGNKYNLGYDSEYQLSFQFNEVLGGKLVESLDKLLKSYPVKVLSH